MKFRDYWKNSLRILRYILFAKYRRGHGIHSPFVFDFITTVLNDKTENPAFLEIEKLRTNLLSNKEKITKWTKDYYDAIHPFSSGGAYINFMMEEGQERVKASYKHNFSRLVEIKKKYDPNNFFRVNQNIKPN